MREIVALVWILAASSAITAMAGDEQPTLTVFNSKEGSSISSIFTDYLAENGVVVNLVKGTQAELVAKLQHGENADVFLGNDVVNFEALKRQGLFSSVHSASLEEAIPTQFREPNGQWFGLSYKARTLMYDPRVTDASTLNTYEDLADPKWKGKLCLRNSGKTYNEALVASLIVRHGVNETRRILRGWVDNLAAPVFDGDQKLLQAIATGTCKVGITNTYYLGRLLAADADFPVRPFWANQGTSGTHANISGMALLKNTKNRALAISLMEYLANDDSQQVFADSNFEFPANPKVRPGTVISDWSRFELDKTPVALFGDLADFAAQVSLSAGYN